MEVKIAHSSWFMFNNLWSEQWYTCHIRFLLPRVRGFDRFWIGNWLFCRILTINSDTFRSSEWRKRWWLVSTLFRFPYGSKFDNRQCFHVNSMPDDLRQVQEISRSNLNLAKMYMGKYNQVYRFSKVTFSQISFFFFLALFLPTSRVCKYFLVLLFLY